MLSVKKIRKNDSDKVKYSIGSDSTTNTYKFCLCIYLKYSNHHFGSVSDKWFYFQSYKLNKLFKKMFLYYKMF